MKPALFQIVESTPCFIGLHTGRYWNGWAVPLFPMATCRQIAADVLDNDGKPIFTFDEYTQCWEQHHPDFPEDGPWIVRPVMVDGVPYWEMGDGYMWERESLSGEWSNYWADGVEIPADKIPLNAQAAILTEVWAGAAVGSVTVDGVTYQWE